jgi:hypothetical protein
MATKEGMVKIKIKLPPSDWHSYAAETFWATPLGDNLYRIENSPFFVDEVSYLDIVFAKAEGEGAIPVVRGVTKRSGNSTYRILLGENIAYEQFCEYIAPATALGCTYEGLKQHQYSLNVPGLITTAPLDAALQKGEEDGIWVFEASHIYTPG